MKKNRSLYLVCDRFKLSNLTELTLQALFKEKVKKLMFLGQKGM